MLKSDVIKIIDEVMNNREIDSIRNAILAIRDKVIEYGDEIEEIDKPVKITLRGGEPSFTNYYFEDAKYICFDPSEKIDTKQYGTIWYE